MKLMKWVLKDLSATTSYYTHIFCFVNNAYQGMFKIYN